ncbi:MAG: CPBP family intramembrane metalloprotease [Clostridia bacterium]|nr:CPBP family intramembrane metalloprotease [Clostridia bacterium]
MNPVFHNTPDPSDTYSPEEVAASETIVPPPVQTSAFSDARRTFSKIGIAFFVLVIATQVAAYGMYFALFYTVPQVLSTWWMNWALSLLPIYAVALPVTLLFLRRVPVAPHNTDFTRRDLTEEKPPFRFKHFLLLLIIAVGAMTAGGVVGNIVMTAFSTFMDYDYANALSDMVGQTPIWFTAICTCICAPLGEELIFRKLLIDRTRRFGDLPSILLSGLLFGLFHGNLFQFFYATAVGMILAYIYTRTGKYWWCVLLHAFLNLMGSIVVPGLADMLPEDLISFTDPVQPIIYAVIMVWQYGGLIAGIVLFCTRLSRRKLSRGTTPLYRENGKALMFRNVGMIACLASMLLLIAINLIPVY